MTALAKGSRTSSLIDLTFLLWGNLNLFAGAWKREACAAPAMRSSVVTIPGDRLWMPTLLIFRSFSSACRSTVTNEPAAQHAWAPGRILQQHLHVSSNQNLKSATGS